MSTTVPIAPVGVAPARLHTLRAVVRRRPTLLVLAVLYLTAASAARTPTTFLLAILLVAAFAVRVVLIARTMNHRT